MDFEFWKSFLSGGLAGIGVFFFGYFLGSEMQRAKKQADRMEDKKIIRRQQQEIEILSRSNATYATVLACSQTPVIIRKHRYSVN